MKEYIVLQNVRGGSLQDTINYHAGLGWSLHSVLLNQLGTNNIIMERLMLVPEQPSVNRRKKKEIELEGTHPDVVLVDDLVEA